uniref:Uncharacterized protein n=1 Tax=Utricularia reniformis TaxID=192314 RepID=A0A1Y0B3E5_9LAMI|nr:hypothetical protein AEK19_MT1755 [Utricularia reniformis]ART31931.1 hypothetical protein AEK19_MT1755 [Utricularia reniformis]
MSRWITFLLSLIAQEQCPGFQEPTPPPLAFPETGSYSDDKCFFFDSLAFQLCGKKKLPYSNQDYSKFIEELKIIETIGKDR